jgi:hypothetical protein
LIPFRALGKPEPLKGGWPDSGRGERINDTDRLVYRATATDLDVVACRFHLRRAARRDVCAATIIELSTGRVARVATPVASINILRDCRSRDAVGAASATSAATRPAIGRNACRG